MTLITSYYAKTTKDTNQNSFNQCVSQHRGSGIKLRSKPGECSKTRLLMIKLPELPRLRAYISTGIHWGTLTLLLSPEKALERLIL